MQAVQLCERQAARSAELSCAHSYALQAGALCQMHKAESPASDEAAHAVMLGQLGFQVINAKH